MADGWGTVADILKVSASPFFFLIDLVTNEVLCLFIIIMLQKSTRKRKKSSPLPSSAHAQPLPVWMQQTVCSAEYDGSEYILSLSPLCSIRSFARKYSLICEYDFDLQHFLSSVHKRQMRE